MQFETYEEINDIEVLLEFELTIHDIGRPAVTYLKNGDPGHPEEPPEYEIELTGVLTHTDLTMEEIETYVNEHYDEIADEAFNNFKNGD